MSSLGFFKTKKVCYVCMNLYEQDSHYIVHKCPFLAGCGLTLLNVLSQQHSKICMSADAMCGICVCA